MTEQSVKVGVFRFNPKRQKRGRLWEYEVPFEHGMRVLDALRWIQENVDGSLAFRWNCRAGKCGSCAAEVNGRAVLTCQEEIHEPTPLTVEPLNVMPVLRDLAVDFTPLWARHKQVTGWLSEKARVSEGDFATMYKQEVAVAQEMRRCIECFICHDVCHVLREHRSREFIGPRFIVKAAALDQHPLEKPQRASLLAKQGLNLCNVTRCCEQACPAGIRITQNAIIPFKEQVLDEQPIHAPFLERFLKRKVIP